MLRLLIVAIVGVLLNQPEWVEEFRPDEKPSIAVLWDASASMRHATWSMPKRPPASPATRARGDRTAHAKRNLATARANGSTS